MNKFIKYFTTTALVILGLGVILTLIGMISGGFDALNNYEIPFNMPYFKDKEMIIVTEYNDGYFDKNIVDQSSIEATNIEDLYIEIGAAKAIIEFTDCESIIFETNDDQAFSYVVEDNTLMINKNSNKLNTKTFLKVQIPQDLILNNVSLKVGASDIIVNNLKANNIYGEVGAGQLTINNSVTNTLYFEVGAGSGVLNNITADEVDLSVGLGNINYKGQINQSLDAEVAMGALTMILNGDEKMYNYNIDQAIGQLEVGSFKVSGIASERYIDNGANKDFDLSCAVGSMVIKFKS